MENNSKQGSKSGIIVTIVFCVPIIAILVLLVLFFVPLRPKIDLSDYIHSNCGISFSLSKNKNAFSSLNNNGYIYDEEKNEVSMPLGLLLNSYIYLMKKEGRTFNRDNDKVICSFYILGLLDNADFINNFVNYVNDNRDTLHSGTYSGKDGAIFVVTYDPSGDNDLLKGTIRIRQKLTLL